MKKTQICKNQEEYQNSQKQVLKRKQICHPNILELVDYIFDDERMITEVFFDYPDNTLNFTNLTTKDTITIFRDIMNAIVHLQNMKMVHGDIRPEYIYYHSTKKCYVLLDRLIDSSSPLQC